MSNIHMEIEQVEQLVAQLQSLKNNINEQSNSLLSFMGRVSWDGSNRVEFEFQLKDCVRGIQNTIGMQEEMISALRSEIAQWQQEGEGFDELKTYEKGKLFITGDGDEIAIHPSDITQGDLGDCYLLASLATVAATNPNIINEMISINDDGSYEVRFFNEVTKKYEYVKVEEKEVKTIFGNAKHVEFGDQGELWPAIIEKGYAKWYDQRDINESKFSLFLEEWGLPGTDNYKLIGKGGLPTVALEQITGNPSTRYAPQEFTPKIIQEAIQEGNPIALGTLQKNSTNIENNPLYDSQQLIPGHAQYITGYDQSTGLVEVRNPWGWDYNQGASYIQLEDLQKSVSRFIVNEIN